MMKTDIYKCSYVRGDKVVETERGKFFITPRCNNKDEVFRYLEKKDFPFFLPMENSTRDSYEVYSYVEDFVDVNDKAIDLVHILSLLHIKTTTYQEVVMDSVKELYEGLILEIDNLLEYYSQLVEEFENHVYMAPDEYLFMRHSSVIFDNLNRSRAYLESWYQMKKDASKERVVFLHKMPCLDTFVDMNTPYFIHWDLSTKGYVIYDFLYFYQKDYDVVEMEALFQIYQSKYLFTADELSLFLAMVLLDEKIVFGNDCYQNTVVIQKHISYAYHARDFVLKQDHKNQKAD